MYTCLFMFKKSYIFDQVDFKYINASQTKKVVTNNVLPI